MEFILLVMGGAFAYSLLSLRTRELQSLLDTAFLGCFILALVAFHYFPEFEIAKYTLLGLSFALLTATAGSSIFGQSNQLSMQDSDLTDLTDLHDLTVHDLTDLTDLDLIDLEKK